MTKGITNMLNLPSLDEVLKEQGVDVNSKTGSANPPAEPPPDPQIASTMEKLNNVTQRMALMEGTDHSDTMDDLYKEIVGHARELMAYGYNMDQPRARGIFEIAATMYGHAMSAVNNKRDAQLKNLKLGLDRRKVDLEERRTNHAVGTTAATVDEHNTIIVEDRNELIKKLRAQINK